MSISVILAVIPVIALFRAVIQNIFGAGFGIALDAADSSKVDYYTWGGIFNTGFWIEPSDKSVGVIATAVFPGRYNQTIALEQKFDEARLPH